MASKQVVQRQTLAGALCAAVTAWRAEVTPALHEQVEPFLGEGEAELDFSRLQEVLGRMVAASLEGMIEADKAHLDELAGDGAHRTRRDGAVTALRRKLIEIRAIAIGLFGRKRSREIVAAFGRIASQPDLLWRLPAAGSSRAFTCLPAGRTWRAESGSRHRDRSPAHRVRTLLNHFFFARRNGYVHLAKAGTCRVWIHTLPWPLKRHTSPSPEKNIDL